VTIHPQTSPAAMAALDTSLRALCGGAVHLPGDPGYDAARQPWDASVDQRPAAVAFPADAGEVAEVVVAAAKAGLRVAVQGTGHAARGLGPLDDAVLLRTSAMVGVRVDPAARRARAEGGALWVDVVEEAAPHGLVALHGSSPGVVGFTLSGAPGWYSRRFGLQIDAVERFELVTPGGDLVRADGPAPGVVTALEFALFPAPEVHAGRLVWGAAETGRVRRAWEEWAAGAPDRVTTVLRVLRDAVVVEGAVLGDPSVLAPLRALRPARDTFAAGPAAALTAADPERATLELRHP
jgi:FAD/FMN-containing dehydrogenase